MLLNTIILASATLLAAIIGAFLIKQRAKNTFKWRSLSYGNIPMWIIHRVYTDGFPNKENIITKHEFFYKGRNHEYKIEIKDFTIKEPFAKISHISVFQRKRPDKEV